MLTEKTKDAPAPAPASSHGATISVEGAIAYFEGDYVPLADAKVRASAEGEPWAQRHPSRPANKTSQIRCHLFVQQAQTVRASWRRWRSTRDPRDAA